jgi:hypothetical protein
MECSTEPSSGIIKSKETQTLVFKIQLQLCESRYFRPGILWGYPLKASPKNHTSFCRVFGNRFRGILSNALGKAPNFFFLTATSEPEPVENDDDRFVHSSVLKVPRVENSSFCSKLSDAPASKILPKELSV